MVPGHERSGWDQIVRSAKQDESGPRTCPEYDECAVEEGHRFEHGRAVELTLMCLSCEAEVVAPA